MSTTRGVLLLYIPDAKGRPGHAILKGAYRGDFNTRPFGPSAPNVFSFAPLGRAITPERPLRFVLYPVDYGIEVKVRGIIHDWSAPMREVPIVP